MWYQHGDSGWDGFLTGVIVIEGEQHLTSALKWLTTYPVWFHSGPLREEKLEAPKTLVQEQLAQGHIEPSTSPWNTAVFAIKKKTGKWRLLHDLRKINAVMETMDAFNQVCHSPQ